MKVDYRFAQHFLVQWQGMLALCLVSRLWEQATLTGVQSNLHLLRHIITF